jgi:hypothetical protein
MVRALARGRRKSTVQRARVLPQSSEALRDPAEPVDTTLLDLVQAVSQETEDEREVIATVLNLLRSGRARLIGNFRGFRF